MSLFSFLRRATQTRPVASKLSGFEQLEDRWTPAVLSYRPTLSVDGGGVPGQPVHLSGGGVPGISLTGGDPGDRVAGGGDPGRSRS